MPLKRVSSWDCIQDETMNAFYTAMLNLMGDMLPKDADGDYPIDIEIIDRRKYNPSHWFDVPYYHKEPEKYFEAVMDNLEMAAAEAQKAFRLRKLDKEEAKGA